MSSPGIVLEYKNVAEYLGDVVAELHRPRLMWGEMGEAMIDIHRQRFQAQMSPEGEKWKALSPSYQKRKKRNKEKILSLNGYLSGTLRYQIESDGLLFGSNLPYAAIHHFGGTIEIKSRQTTLYFKQNKDGSVNNQFAKKSKSNYSETHTIPAYHITMPERPWLGLSSADEERLLNIAKKHLFQINA